MKIREPKINNDYLSVKRRLKVIDILEKVRLHGDHYNRFPRKLSIGQQQKVEVARPLMLKPKLIILNQPVSGLDVSIQAQVLNLF
jgi:peptide/nickel transport system ATP-binding protein